MLLLSFLKVNQLHRYNNQVKCVLIYVKTFSFLMAIKLFLQNDKNNNEG